MKCGGSASLHAAVIIDDCSSCRATPRRRQPGATVMLVIMAKGAPGRQPTAEAMVSPAQRRVTLQTPTGVLLPLLLLLLLVVVVELLVLVLVLSLLMLLPPPGSNQLGS